MTHAHSTRKVLLIDDEAYFRKFVSQVFKKAMVGSVLEARDGREGVKLFQENQPDMVVLDISMPHMDGLKTLTALRQLSSVTPIIMLTSVSEEKVVEECVDEGATFFIRKDVSAPQLAGALQEAIDEFLA
jgi:CheY-like chemotaxis protein